MSERTRRRWRLGASCLVLAAAACSFFVGIGWGLPTRSVDPYLFGQVSPWSGSRILELAPPDSDDRGADVDANPLADRSGSVVLNETDGQRAEIIRRYRLFSHQPDEMITFKSLSRLRENYGDPRLYQYGGLWVYPVGALLQAASMIGYLDLRSGADGQAFYLDHPEAFGRFYVVARGYSAAWGLIGAWAIFWLARRLTGTVPVAAAAGLCFAMMPVVVNLAHEAKPHLPGTVLMLLAVVAAVRYVETGATRWAAAAGVLCGAAFGMIISAVVAFVILLVMTLLRDDPMQRRMTALAIALMLGTAMYVLTNPFVILNTVFRPQRFSSNINNSTAMYSGSGGGFANAIWLIIEGASPLLAAAGVMGLFILLRRPVGKLLAAPAALVAVIFFLLANGKPPEYARFALFLDVTLLLSTFALIGTIRGRAPRGVAASALVGFTALSALPYWTGFLRDSGFNTTRLAAAEKLRELTQGREVDVRVIAEPAPYSVPPIDLFRCRLVLFPPRVPAEAEVAVRTDERHASNPMSWASVPFVIASIDPATRPSTTQPVSSP